MFRKSAVWILLPVIVISSLLPVGSVKATESLGDYSSGAPLVISEIQSGGITEAGAEDGRKEFIELYNQLAEDLDVTGWKIEYFSASREDVALPEAAPFREIATLSGLVQTNGYILFSFDGYLPEADGYFGQGSTSTSGFLAKTGGHIRIVDNSGQVIDRIGWGTAKSPETKAVTEIPQGFSVQRKIYIDKMNMFIDTDNNYLDFTTPSTETTPTGGFLYAPPVDKEEPDPVIEETRCNEVIISEILPNPLGADTGKEYIELYNPTDQIISMLGCTLKTTANTNQYVFTVSDVLEPGEHRAFYDSITGLTLANAAGGEVWLISVGNEQVVQYPQDMKDDYTWTLIDNVWQVTSLATPNSPNSLPLTQDVEEENEELVPCPEGTYRHPETKRCRRVEVASTQTPCGPGQERNPATNRCRSTATSRSQLAPCKPGQERSVETNRCRSVASAKTTACQKGYERNPETNRCRKKAASTTNLASSTTEAEADIATKVNYYILSIVSLMIVAYGTYEYRLDISNFMERRRAKPSTSKTLK